MTLTISGKKPWKSKYKAQPVIREGVRFASKKEFSRYLELKLLERGGHLRNLELQPRFDITINGKYCGFYKADFAYFANKKRVIEDVKGMKTPVYNLKKKIIEAMYNVEIVEK